MMRRTVGGLSVQAQARMMTGVSSAAVVLLLALTSAALSQSTALSQKATEANEIATIAQRDGSVRVIVQFDSPTPATEVRPDPANLADVKARVAAAQDAVISAHFGSATSPGPAQRGLVRFEITPGFALSVTPAELDSLAADPRVSRIQYDRAEPPGLIQSVPLIGMPAAYAVGATGQGQAVAVIDTGVQAGHEFLAGKVIAEACFSAANGGGGAGTVSLCPNGTPTQIGAGAANPETAQCISGANQLCDHGTHVAGIAAGLNTNQQTGEPPNGVGRNASVWAIQVFTRFNTAAACAPSPAPCVLSFTSDMVRALDHVFVNLNSLPGGVKVASANMSIGGGAFPGTCDGDSRKPAIDNLRNAGVLTAISAGNNSSTSNISAPACISTAVAVGSTTKSDTISPFSNMSATVDLLAPGSSILSSIPVVPPGNTTTYAFFNGTSMAAPHVAGAIAAIRSACPTATAGAIENALKATGVPVTDSRPGGTQTKPRIRVDLAVNSLNCTPASSPLSCTFVSRLADLNGDGRDDLVLRRNNGQVSAFLLNGASVVDAQVIGTVGLEWTLVGIGDFNGDGRSDLLMRRPDGAFAVFLMNGFQFIDAQIIGIVGTDWTVVGVGDFNGDGRADVAFRRPNGQVAIFLMNGLQFIDAQIIGTIGNEWRVAAIADFNGDGRADFLLRRTTDGALSLFQMNGFEVSAAAVIGTVGLDWTLIGAADFNGDGRADMLFRRDNGQLSIFLMNGPQFVDAQIIGTVGRDWRFIATGDVNGDGRADLVFRRSNGELAVFQMNGFTVVSADVIASVGIDWESCYGQGNRATTAELN